MAFYHLTPPKKILNWTPSPRCGSAWYSRSPQVSPLHWLHGCIDALDRATGRVGLVIAVEMVGRWENSMESLQTPWKKPYHDYHVVKHVLFDICWPYVEHVTIYKLLWSSWTLAKYRVHPLKTWIWPIYTGYGVGFIWSHEQHKSHPVSSVSSAQLLDGSSFEVIPNSINQQPILSNQPNSRIPQPACSWVEPTGIRVEMTQCPPERCGEARQFLGESRVSKGTMGYSWKLMESSFFWW